MVETRKLAELRKYPKNPRSITPEKFVDLLKKVRRWGQLGSLLIDGRDKTTILGGNHVYEAMLENGMTEGKVEYRTPKDDAEALELCIVHNESFARWVEEDLAKLLKEHQASIDLSAYSIDLGRQTDLKKVLARFGETDEDDFDPTVPDVPDSELGKVYQMGRHRLMCGDSTNQEHVTKLMGGELAKLVVTDPPYGISYKGNPNGEKWDMIENDDLRGDDLLKFLAVAFENIAQHAIPNMPMYVFYASNNHAQFEKAIQLANFTVKQQIIWVKHMVIGNSDYHWSHEPVFYTHLGSEKAPFYGDRTNTTVIETSRYKDLAKMSKEELLAVIMSIKEQSTIQHAWQDSVRGQAYKHPTQKPIAILTPFIKNSSSPNDIVLDLFCGSGSTMIACHQLDRVSYSMELDPGFCDVIRRRYAKFIGEEDKWKNLTPEI